MATCIITFCVLITISRSTVPSQANYDAVNDHLPCGFVVTPNDANFHQFATSSVSTFDAVNIPSAIIMAACESDIIITMKWIQSFLDSIQFTIRSGGHSFGGYSKANNAILIDLSQMNEIDILQDNILSVESGVDQSLYEEWKVTNPGITYTIPHGVSGDPGIGGFATGGGIGLTTRKWGVTADYIHGVRVILCDGSLWEIYEDNEENTKCVQGCTNSDGEGDSDDYELDLDYDDLQNLLYAIKGGGGGNFGIITRYYFNTISDPQFPMHFVLTYPVLSRSDIYNALKASTNLLTIDFVNDNNWGLLTIIGPGPTPDLSFVAVFVGVYLSETSDTTIFDQFVAKIQEYMGTTQPLAQFTYTIVGLSLSQIYISSIFPTLKGGVDIASLNAYFSSRLMYQETFDNEMDEVFINAVSDYLHGISPILLQNGVISTFAIESLGGAINVNNEKTSFPVQNRVALASTQVNFVIPPLPPQTPPDVIQSIFNLAKISRDAFDEQILSLIGDRKYINYIDDTNNDLSLYYSSNEIAALSEIQQDIDPNGCFIFRAGINRDHGDESSDSDSD